MRIIVVLLIYFACILSGCSGNPHVSEESPALPPASQEAEQERNVIDSNTRPDKEEPTGDYISLTSTEYDNGSDASAGMTSRIWYYDIASDTLEEIFSFETTAQYSLGCYDREHDKVYYTHRVPNKSKYQYGDQIFVYDRSQGTTTQLTDDLFAVNDLLPVMDRLYFIAASLDDPFRSERLGYIDLATGERHYWRENDDTFVECMVIDKQNQDIFLTGYSLKERAFRVAHQGNNDFIIPLHTVYHTDLDFSETEELYSDHAWLRSIMTTQDRIDILSDEKYNTSSIPTTIISCNLTSKEFEKRTWDSDRLHQRAPNYTSDGQSIYGIVTMEDMTRGIGRYDVATKDMTLCFPTKQGRFINNMCLIRP